MGITEEGAEILAQADAATVRELGAWLAELGVAPGPVMPLAIPDVVRGVAVPGRGPGRAGARPAPPIPLTVGTAERRALAPLLPCRGSGRAWMRRGR